ncbi:MAG: DEAD/DEAH box helicase [Bacteroidota bacterium]|nr:DEAD/DEAH box helicase [Bacteroidota bacterium]
MKFENYRISEEIKKSLAKKGFKRPTDIQFKCIPAILKGQDILAIAQTGTGKTAAFAIPIIDTLYERKKFTRPDGIKCIVMVPTRELATQITDVFNEIAHHTSVKTLSIFGGVNQEPQIDMLEKGADILVATPGRLFDLVSQGHIRLHRVEILVLDEADHMLDLGFIHDIRQLTKQLPKNRQTLFFSATINELIKDLSYSLVDSPIRIQISPKDPVAKNIDHYVSFVEMDDKRFFLERLINENPECKILVFVRTKVRAERVMLAMKRVGIESQTIHGGKDQEDRTDVLDDFRTGAIKVLIATDVSARGIDISNVEYVVNYDLPEKSENYVHRVGRTGRGKEKGKAIAFCSIDEKPILEEIESFLGQEVKVLNIDKSSYKETIELTKDQSWDWKALIVEENENEKKRKKLKIKKKIKKNIKKKKK